MMILVRHAEAEHNVNSKRVSGRALNSTLTLKGVAQAKKLARQLDSNNIDVIYHTSTRRSLDTAKLVADNLRVKPKLVPDDRFIEMEQGRQSGRFKLLTVLSPIIFINLLIKGRDFRFSGGESFNQVAQRMAEGISEIANKKQTAVIITHGMAMRALKAHRDNWSVWRIILTKIPHAKPIIWRN